MINGVTFESDETLYLPLIFEVFRVGAFAAENHLHGLTTLLEMFRLLVFWDTLFEAVEIETISYVFKVDL